MGEYYTQERQWLGQCNHRSSVKREFSQCGSNGIYAEGELILKDPAPAILLSAYLNSSIQYTVRVWVDAADYWTVYGNINEGVRESFARHNVEMTYEHVNVHLVKE